MPSSETFSIRPVAMLLDRWLEPGWTIVDPFARNSSRGTLTNDLNPDTKARFHFKATEFLQRTITTGVVADAGLLDPPYSPRQIKDCYQLVGMPVDRCATQHAKLIADAKDAMAPLIRLGGIVVTCGWNSQGMGRKRGFEVMEILLIQHGGSHNDTIVTVERRAVA
jgi:hypothetical protein